MPTTLAKRDRRKIRMINYFSFLVAAFLSLAFAFISAFFAWWVTASFLLFAGWLFPMMHQSARKNIPEGKPFSLDVIRDIVIHFRSGKSSAEIRHGGDC